MNTTVVFLPDRLRPAGTCALAGSTPCSDFMNSLLTNPGAVFGRAPRFVNARPPVHRQSHRHALGAETVSAPTSATVQITAGGSILVPSPSPPSPASPPPPPPGSGGGSTAPVTIVTPVAASSSSGGGWKQYVGPIVGSVGGALGSFVAFKFLQKFRKTPSGKKFDMCVESCVNRLFCVKEHDFCPVFISFRVAEASAEAALLQRVLGEHGAKAYVCNAGPTKIAAGENWEDAITEALSRSTLIVVLGTKTYGARHECRLRSWTWRRSEVPHACSEEGSDCGGLTEA